MGIDYDAFMGRLLCVAASLLYLLTGVPAARAQGDCGTMEKLTEDAMKKLETVPVHIFITSKMGAQNIATEMIYASNSVYVKIGNEWKISGTIKDMEALSEEAKKKASANQTCRQLPDETVNGESAAVYSTHAESAKGDLDMEIWISKSKGLILKMETKTDGGKNVIASRYDYANVKGPL
jgi:hypothetical protein